MNKKDKLQAQRNELFDHSTTTLARIKELDEEIQAVIDKKKEPEEVDVLKKFNNGDYGTGRHDGEDVFWIVAQWDDGTGGNVFTVKDKKYGGIWHMLTDVVKTGNALEDMNAKQAKVGEKSEQGKSEPKLRHGDLYGDENIACIILKNRDQKGKWEFRHKDGSGDVRTEEQVLMHIKSLTYYGNLIADLTETCEGFEMENGGGYTSLTAITGDSMDSGVRIRHGNASVVIGGSVLDEFIANLQKVANHIRSKK